MQGLPRIPYSLFVQVKLVASLYEYLKLSPEGFSRPANRVGQGHLWKQLLANVSRDLGHQCPNSLVLQQDKSEALVD